MKVLLNGATSGSNFGDFLFAKMFQDQITNLIGQDNVYWYKSHFALSNFFAHYLNYNKKYHLKEINALVYISGGYFHGDDLCIKDYAIRYLRYFHIGICCLLRRIPYIIIGVEIGPTKNKLLRYIEKIILKYAKVVIVRNTESKYFATEMGANDVITTADTVFAMNRSIYKDKKIPIEIEACKKSKLFLHINPLVERNYEIVKKIVPIINNFCKKHGEYAIIVGTDQFSSKQKEAFNYVRSQLNVAECFYNEYNNPLELCNILEHCDLIVTHKLHVGIVGAYLGKSVISFSGHTSKIERLYKQLNIIERTTPLAHLTIEKGLSTMERFYNLPIVVPKEITALAKQNLQYLIDFVNNYRK